MRIRLGGFGLKLGSNMEIPVNGVSLFVKSVGSAHNYPLILLHGGPGLDHNELHPWLDRLADQFWLLYVDQRGQGRSQRVDPSTLSPSVFASDVSELAAALRLREYALLGHSYGAIVTLVHAIERGDASRYVISHGAASGTKLMEDVRANLAAFEPIELRDQVSRSWAMEPNVKTAADCAEVLRLQMPFHFATTDSDAYRRYMALPDQTVYSPEVLAYASSHDYPFEYEERLSQVQRPTLVISAEHDRACTPRSARDIAAGVAGSELVILKDAGHMSYIEQPDAYFAAVRGFLARRPVAPAAKS